MASNQCNLSWVNADKAWDRLPKKPDGTIDWANVRLAHVDAAAAMWLRRHGADIQQRYGNTWRRVEAFRHLLFASQQPLPIKISATARAGRLDIDRLLSLPLPDPAGLQKETDLAGDDLF